MLCHAVMLCANSWLLLWAQAELAPVAAANGAAVAALLPRVLADLPRQRAAAENRETRAAFVRDYYMVPTPAARAHTDTYACMHACLHTRGSQVKTSRAETKQTAWRDRALRRRGFTSEHACSATQRPASMREGLYHGCCSGSQFFDVNFKDRIESNIMLKAGDCVYLPDQLQQLGKQRGEIVWVGAQKQRETKRSLKREKREQQQRELAMAAEHNAFQHPRYTAGASRCLHRER